MRWHAVQVLAGRDFNSLSRAGQESSENAGYLLNIIPMY